MENNLNRTNKIMRYGILGFMSLLTMILLLILIPVTYIENVYKWIRILMQRLDL
jgi:hypothetical protein